MINVKFLSASGSRTFKDQGRITMQTRKRQNTLSKITGLFYSVVFLSSCAVSPEEGSMPFAPPDYASIVGYRQNDPVYRVNCYHGTVTLVAPAIKTTFYDEEDSLIDMDDFCLKYQSTRYSER